MHELLNIAPEVANAILAQRPVVALESTVIAHGLPRPQNLQTARRLQETPGFVAKALFDRGRGCPLAALRGKLGHSLHFHGEMP